MSIDDDFNTVKLVQVNQVLFVLVIIVLLLKRLQYCGNFNIDDHNMD